MILKDVERLECFGHIVPKEFDTESYIEGMCAVLEELDKLPIICSDDPSKSNPQNTYSRHVNLWNSPGGDTVINLDNILEYNTINKFPGGNMKIIKTGRDAAKLAFKKSQALEGCNICPFCKESHTMEEYMYTKDFLKKGISGGICSTRFIGNKPMQVNHFKCLTCGAEWDSEPFEI